MNSGDASVFINRNSENVLEFTSDWVLDWKRYFDDIYTLRPFSDL